MADSKLFQLLSPFLGGIKKFYHAHKGEEGYLFGDGITIKSFDLKLFSSKPSIIGGYVGFHKDFKYLNAPYFSLIDPFWFYPFIRYTGNDRPLLRNKIQQEYRKLFTQYRDRTFFVNLSNMPVIQNRNVVYVYKDIPDSRLSETFISRRMDCFQGTLRAQILLSIYMGFEKVYLVGHDYTHNPSRSLHFYEKGTGVFTGLTDWNCEFFKIAQEYIDIISVTLDSGCDCLKHVTYAEHTGVQPIFRDNVDIVDPHYLQTLSSWPGYKIF